MYVADVEKNREEFLDACSLKNTASCMESIQKHGKIRT